MRKKWCLRDKYSLRISANQRGEKAERLAKQYICSQGLTFLAKNVRYPFGEIDLIAEDGDELVFIEVKFRSNSSHGLASETVSKKKQKRLTLAAQRWLKDNQRYQNRYCRVDLIAIDSRIDVKHLNWEKNAFQASEYP